MVFHFSVVDQEEVSVSLIEVEPVSSYAVGDAQ